VITRDPDIRRVLHARLAATYADDADTEIVDEMAVCQAGARADVAVINGHLGGFEIKSDVDSLARLPRQTKYFSRVFDCMTLVCADRHTAAATALVPDWWGIWAAEVLSGTVHLRPVRSGGRNPEPSGWARATLLRRWEMTELLLAHGAPARFARAPRRELVPALLEMVQPEVLDAEIRRYLRVRAA
jgi:hypothetical protein